MPGKSDTKEKRSGGQPQRCWRKDLDWELAKHGRQMQVDAEKAWREWMFGTNIDNVVARK